MREYTGTLTDFEQQLVRRFYKAGHSERDVAVEARVPYSKVRTFVSYLKQETGGPSLPQPPGEYRLLYYDIETAPTLAWVWKLWKTNVIEVEQNWYLLSCSWKWAGDKNTSFISIMDDPDFHPDTDNDRVVAEKLHQLFVEADAIVAHHGDRFDLPKLQSKFLKHDLGPVPKMTQIDTRKQAARVFGAPGQSMSLKALAEYLGFGTKITHQGFELWRDCMKGDPKAWTTMEKYNRHDVVLLERLYERLLPFIDTPNKGFWDKGVTVCPSCGSLDLSKRGVRRTAVSEFVRFSCGNCGAWSRARKRKPQIEDLHTDIPLRS